MPYNVKNVTFSQPVKGSNTNKESVFNYPPTSEFVADWEDKNPELVTIPRRDNPAPNTTTEPETTETETTDDTDGE